MLIFDQLKRNDPHLRLLTMVIAGGMLILLAGLWWMQIVSAKEYQANLQTQSFRTVRISAVRGKILDRDGNTLAENKPSYNVSLYLDDLRDQYRAEYARVRPTKVVSNSLPFWKDWLGFAAVETQRVRLKKAEIDELQWQVHCKVVSNSLMQVSQRIQSPARFDAQNFKLHCQRNLPMPYSVARNINSNQVARFEEQSWNPAGMYLEIQSSRVYPHQTTAAHLLGYLRYDIDSLEGEEAFFSYRMPDFSGVLGLERAYDRWLHGRAGGKSVVVNSLGYRQSETVWKPAESGLNVVLAINLHIQQATERALQEAPISSPHGAAVVMDINTGDVLALASVPTFNPNFFVDNQSFPPDYYAKMQTSGAEHNRATGENYAPGSIFKPLVALACLENGLDPKATYEVQANPRDPNHGIIYVGRGRRSIKDTVRPGLYDLKLALMESSNSYFVTNGLRYGVEKVVQLGNQMHLGESFGLSNRQETAGIFPSLKRIQRGWSDGQTANLCIGQGEIAVSPLQMAVLACALANNGKVLRPRFVDRIESQDPLSGDPPIVTPKGVVRDRLAVKPRNFQIVRDALAAEVQGGTGHRAFIPGFPACGKTGTAEIQNERGETYDQTTWFLSFAPYEKPRYAVVVMIEHGVSGGVTCAPVARRIYEAILEAERMNGAKTGTLARTQ
jgi:penicillin-binding protein 2